MTLKVLRRHPAPRRREASGLGAARALERAVAQLDAPGRGLSCVPAAHRALVVAARREMLALSTDLVECDRCPPEAVALAHDIARRGTMPFYSAAGSRRILERARTARAIVADEARASA
jgi:hypothetical protein